MRKLFIFVIFDLLVLLLAGLAYGQSVSPVVFEYTGKAATAPAVVPNTLPTNRAQKAVSEFDAFASHSAGESGFVKRTVQSKTKPDSRSSG